MPTVTVTLLVLTVFVPVTISPNLYGTTFFVVFGGSTTVSRSGTRSPTLLGEHGPDVKPVTALVEVNVHVVAFDTVADSVTIPPLL